ncbi:MAG: hypothetical protein ACRD9R_05185 [Pyrinomonadaceae bacterium]
MTNGRCDADQPDAAAAGSLPADDLPQQSGGEVRVNYSRTAPRGDAARTIHQRPPVPPMSEGEAVPDRDPSPPVDIEPPRPRRR